MIFDSEEIRKAFLHFDSKLSAEFSYKNLGGGAFNAATSFSYLGGDATICVPLGNGFSQDFALTEMDIAKVDLIDVADGQNYPVAECNIVIRSNDGGRNILVPEKSKTQLNIDPRHITNVVWDFIDDFDVIRADTKYLEFSLPVVRLAKGKGIPIILDTGHEWSSNLAERRSIINDLLPNTDIVLCSSGCLPFGANTNQEAIELLLDSGVQNVVVSAGGYPIHFAGQDGVIETHAPEIIQPLDTLGAGDVFAGALAYYYTQYDLRESVVEASAMASKHCRFYGKAWMEQYQPQNDLHHHFDV